MKANLGDEVIIHIVGTKSDVVAQDPGTRRVGFERCIEFVAENLYPEKSEPVVGSSSDSGFKSLDGNSKTSSGFWGQDIGFDCCHEISASSGEGIDEVFRVITRKLVEQKQKKVEAELAEKKINSAGTEQSQGGFSDVHGSDGHGSFRVGYGDKRRSWLGLPTSSISIGDTAAAGPEHGQKARKKGCC